MDIAIWETNIKTKRMKIINISLKVIMKKNPATKYVNPIAKNIEIDEIKTPASVVPIEYSKKLKKGSIEDHVPAEISLKIFAHTVPKLVPTTI